MTINIKRIGRNTLLNFNPREALHEAQPTRALPLTFGQIGWLRGLDFTRPLAYIAAETRGETSNYGEYFTPTTQPTCKHLKRKQYKVIPLEQLKDEINYSNLAWYANTLRRDEQHWKRQYDLAMYGLNTTSTHQ